MCCQIVAKAERIYFPAGKHLSPKCCLLSYTSASFYFSIKSSFIYTYYNIFSGKFNFMDEPIPKSLLILR